LNRYAKAPSSGSSTRQGSRLGAVIRGAFATRGVFSGVEGSGAPATSSARRRLLVLLAGTLALSLLFGAGRASAAPPAVSVEDAANVSYTSADVEGTVDPKGQSTTWRFQYATEADFSNAQDGPSGTTEVSETLTGQLTGLQPHTTSHLRLVAENGDGPSEAVAANTFTTEEVSKPTLTAPIADSVTATSAQFSAEVTAGGSDPAFQTSCSFDYVTDEAFNHFVNERQQVGIEAESGSFQLVYTSLNPYAAHKTVPIAFDAPANGPGSVQEALEALPNVPAGSINVSGGPGDSTASNPYVVEFTGPLSGENVVTMEIDRGGLLPAPPGPSTVGAGLIADGVPGGFASGGVKHVGCAPASISGTSATPVSAEAGFLQPGITYHLRLVATNAGGQSQAVSAQTFTTLTSAPVVSTTAPDPVGPETAALDGVVNPRNAPTTYWFEWGTEDCEVSACQSTAHASAGYDEMQVLNISSNDPVENLNFTFEGETTAAISRDAPGIQVQEALEGLPAVGPGNIKVVGGGGSKEDVFTFTGDLASSNVGQITVNSGGSTLMRTVLEGGYGGAPKHVAHTLTGLQPETTYHFRLVAQNPTGIVESLDRQFTTAGPKAACPNQGMPGASFLPDCRAYEMVSQPDKQGSDIQSESMLTFSSASGNALSYAASSGYGDVIGTTPNVQLLSRRTGASATNGWSSHAISPAVTAPNITASSNSGIPGFETFNPELTAAVYASWSTLTGYPDPNVTETPNLYRLDDLDAGQPPAKLLTHSASPLPANGLTKRLFRNDFVGASEDLSHVFIQSGWNLTDHAGTPEIDTSANGDLYEYTDATGLRRVGRIPSGSETQCDDLTGAPSCVDAAVRPAFIRSTGTSLTGGYTQKTISPDGSRILFTTAEHPGGSTSLLPGQIYMREDGHITYHLNASERTPGSESGDALIQAMTPDGSRVFFTTNASLVDADDDGGGSDLYMYEVDKPVGHRLTLISADRPGVSGDAHEVVGTSEDGRYVYFVGAGQLVPGEPADQRNGLYLWHDGDISFIGNFGEGTSYGAPYVDSISNAQDSRTSVPHGQLVSRVSPDGHTVLFMSEESGAFAGRGGYAGHYNGGNACTGSFLGGHEPCRQLYLYNADSGRITCVSCDFESDSVTSDAITDAPLGLVVSRPTQHLSHALSDDGRHVFFSTAEALVGEDTNGNYDAYEYDVATESVHLISSGTDSEGSYFLDASPDGHDVFFSTKEKLVGWDTDNSVDVYDARVDGGFPEPTPVPVACQGESCLPSSPPPPGAPSAASSAPKPGNPKSPRRCARGFRSAKRHGKARCVKKRGSKHRKANTNGRAGK
jgi:hypothetical protein